jgi:hypothetical protein
MKKDAVYSMRMNSRVRQALTRAAHRERRTVASLMDKIITDYLAREGFLTEADFGAERRRFNRKKVTVPAQTVLKSGDNEQSVPGVLLDISMGGALLTYPKGSDVRFSSTGKLPQFELCLEGQGSDQQLCLDCESRYMRDTGNEIQIGASFVNLNEEEAEKLSRYVT